MAYKCLTGFERNVPGCTECGRLSGRRIAFQVWDWAPDGRSYRFTQFFIREVQGDYHTTYHVSQLRAVLREELTQVLHVTGFSEIYWHMPADSGFYQLMVSARRES